MVPTGLYTPLYINGVFGWRIAYIIPDLSFDQTKHYSQHRDLPKTTRNLMRIAVSVELSRCLWLFNGMIRHNEMLATLGAFESFY